MPSKWSQAQKFRGSIVSNDSIDALDEETTPLNVKVINSNKPGKTPYDSTDCLEYDEMLITDEEIKEFENNDDTPTKKK